MKNATPSKRNWCFPRSSVLKPTLPWTAADTAKWEPELFLEGFDGGRFFRAFSASFFFGFLVLQGGFGTPWGGSKSTKNAKSWLREAIFEWILLVLGFVIKNQGFFAFLVPKSDVFLVVFLRPSAGTSVSIFASFARSDYADYTIKTKKNQHF